MGIYVFEPDVLEAIPEGSCSSSPTSCSGCWPRASSVAPTGPTPSWYDIGTIAEYERAVAELELHDS